MIVVDASAVLEILLRSEIGERLEAAVSGLTLEAPHILDIEVAHVLRRWAASGKMTSGQATEALALFLEMPIRRHPHTHLMPEIWKLRHELTAYDAAYLALARRLDAELLTTDDGLRKRAKRR
jgi:predicted nucleic acid-binding protein